MANWSRRTALKLVGGSAVHFLAGTQNHVSGQTPLTRKSVSDLSPNGPEISALRTAVSRMKALPGSDPKSWQAQAEIHLRYCPHYNWYFLPWHRAYLHFFEKICRELSGDETFALPYWDWSNHPSIPAAFWGDASNQLFDPTRAVGPNDRARRDQVGTAIIQRILGSREFDSFASPKPDNPNDQREVKGLGQLEGAPHNYIHAFVGFRPGRRQETLRRCVLTDWQAGFLGHMGQFCSPLDPIFWLHHCNIDRLWSSWRQCRANTSDTSWLGFPLERFYDTSQGAHRSIAVQQMLETTALGYRYDNLVTHPDMCAAPESQPTALSEFRTDTANAAPWFGSTPWMSRVAATEAFVSAAGTARFAGPEPSTVILQVEGVERPADPAAEVRVFLNCPYLSVETPPTDPHFVAGFEFFGHHQHGPVSLRMDATDVVRNLVLTGKLDFAKESLIVQLLTVGFNGDEPTTLEEVHPGPKSVSVALKR